MPTPKYDKWTVHSLTRDDRSGAEIHDGADGLTYRVTTREAPDGRSVVASLEIVTTEAHPGGVDRAFLRRVPIALLRDFALSQLREQKALEPGAILLDLTHFETEEGHTAHPAHPADLEALADLYKSLPRRVRTEGRIVPRRDFLVAEPKSPYYGMSYSWLDKRIRRARDAGLIPESPDTADPTSGPTAGPNKETKK